MTELSRLRGSEGYAVRANSQAFSLRGGQRSERSFRQKAQPGGGNEVERTLRNPTCFTKRKPEAFFLRGGATE